MRASGVAPPVESFIRSGANIRASFLDCKNLMSVSGSIFAFGVKVITVAVSALSILRIPIASHLIRSLCVAIKRSAALGNLP